MMILFHFEKKRSEKVYRSNYIYIFIHVYFCLLLHFDIGLSIK